MNETAVSSAAASPASCRLPRDDQKDAAAEGTRHSRSAPGKSRGHLCALCGPCARSAVDLFTFGLAAVLLAGSLSAQIPPSRPAAALYRRLQSVGLDASRVYQVRDAALDRQDLHLSLNDGIIAFTDDVEGRTTGAFFEGEGEVLLVPPDRAERASLALFTRAAVLEERFSTAYFRFFDDRFLSDLEPALRPITRRGEGALGTPDPHPSEPKAGSLGAPDFHPSEPKAGALGAPDFHPSEPKAGALGAPDLRPSEPKAGALGAPDFHPSEPKAGALGAPDFHPLENADEFVARWNPAARTLAQGDALRLLAALTSRSSAPLTIMHARLGGARLGTFDVFFDAGREEQISVGQMAYSHGAPYYDVWLSFPSRSARAHPEVGSALRSLDAGGPESAADPFTISRCQVRAHVVPPRDLEAEATLELELGAGADSERTLFFELSRYLKVSSVTAAPPPHGGAGEAQPLEFIQNEALEGSELARRGNDVVAVVFPEALHRGQRLQLRFVYSGSVLSEAGGGLLYVGARGIWYPNRGLEMTNFDLEFRYPPGWTLLATGKRESLPTESDGGEQVARWRSERPLPVAGFNLGQYLSSDARAGETLVESFAARGVEASFPQPPPAIVPAPEALMRAWPPRSTSPPLVAIPPPPPAPAANAPLVAQRAAAVINFLSSRIGPFPYSSLAITQMPGQLSEGWPGLVFLSTPAWLNPEQRTAVAGPSAEVSYRYLVIAHETAHQWWGDAVYWRAYRDQWVMEALANYCALMSLEAKNPNEVRAILEHYRQGLLEESAGGGEARAAGPVTLGTRLSSSRFPRGYEVVGYGRGTWLFHMLRHMLRNRGQWPVVSGQESDGAAVRKSAVADRDPDRLFFTALRNLQQRYQGKQVSTVDVLQAMEEVLPASLDFEGGPAAGRHSLDWFLQGWVNGTAIPGLALREVRIGPKNGKRLATGKIIQRNAPQDLVTSVPIYADIAGARPVLLGRVFADGPETSFRLTAPAATRKLLLDPYKTVLSR